MNDLYALPDINGYYTTEYNGRFMYRHIKTGHYTDNPIPEPTPEERLTALERENNLLRAQVQAAADQNEFLEDCIAEMAGVVYG